MFALQKVAIITAPPAQSIRLGHHINFPFSQTGNSEIDMVSPICYNFFEQGWYLGERPRFLRLNQVPGFQMRALDRLVLTRLPSLLYYLERKHRENPLIRVRNVTRHKMGYFVLNSANSG